MAITQISKEEFHNYNFESFPTFVAKEKSWYADDDANIIATILLDNFDKDWSYVILGKDEDEEYRAIDVEVSIDEFNDVVKNLYSKMNEISIAGKMEKKIYESTLFRPESSVIITDMDDAVKKYFKKYPEKLYEINSRKFEELIASIFKDLGFDVELTKATRDGGQDIIASIKNSVTSFLAYIECKRYAPDNKVGVGIIRNVAGVHYLRKPCKSIIVTTSFFTKDAQEEAKLIENQLDLKDYNDIKSWLGERY
jgi:HJR/Mrr/RecB family endonuclease